MIKIIRKVFKYKEQINAKKVILVLILLTILFIVFVGGLMVSIKWSQPRDLIMNVYKSIFRKDIFETINQIHLETDVSSLITIKSEQDVIERRKKLVNIIWKGQGFPTRIPDEVKRDITDERFSDLRNLKRIDEITTLMEYGLDSIIYHFHPIKENGELVIYQQGHSGGFILGKETIDFFLDKGYSVIASAMPVLGMNSQPVVDLKRFGVMKLEHHDLFIFLETDEISPMKFFLEPIARVLNSVDYEHIYMVGISGGACVAVLYSALDTRIDKSYQVAGSQPIFVRNVSGKGDYEETLFEVYNVANYLELYIMGSLGRRQLQIFNKYDPIGFEGIGYQLYEKEVKKLVRDLMFI